MHAISNSFGKMKKLTEEWKVKKGHLKNKSFRESIDYALSDTPETEKCNRQNQASGRKKQSVSKSILSSLNVTPVVASDVNSPTSLRRSSRLKEKLCAGKLVDKKINYSKDEASFSFSESFGLQMANEASKYEKVFLSADFAVANTDPTEKQNELSQNIKNSKNKNVTEKSENTTTSPKRNKNYDIKLNENIIIPSSSNTTNHEIKTSSNHITQENCLNAVQTKNTVKKVSTNYSLKEIKAEILNENQLASSSLDSRNNSAYGEVDCLDLAYWGLPSQVISAYRSRNINKMFQWQYECLSVKNVLNGKNLVYSAPTSAGKTLVAEILMLKKVLESKKKAMMILPFVSVVREKVNYLQEMFQDTGLVVGGYMGAHRPPGGFKATDISICTIEKANNLINRLMEEKRLNELGILVVDELHMLGDNSRGYLLELLLTKLLYNCKKSDIDMQIIGMSATLPNLNVLSFWLNAELYHTDFRPVPLHEMYKVGAAIFDSKTNRLLREMGKNSITLANDSDHTIYLTVETVASGNGVLVFCPSKNWCETLATSIAREIYNIGRPSQDKRKSPAYECIGQKLRENINGSLLSDILLQLRNSSAGLDGVLKLTVPFGVAFHHAGLTYDERDIIEGAFKQGILKVLVATSTLSSGVNLPARRVLIRSPLFCGSVIDTLSYKQMVGRAGRKGIDDQGESILLCKESERKFAMQLVGSELQPVKSCLMKSGKDGLHSSLKRAIIEVIASGAATTHEEVIQYVSCTLLFASLIHKNNKEELSDSDVEASINKCLDYLLDNDFVFKIEKKDDDSTNVSYKPSQLGSAILASGFSPEDSLRILKELQLARRSFVLENDLHILYEVTPPYLSDQMGSINWMNFLTLWEQLPDDYHRVGELVGVRENFIGLGIQGKIKMNSAQAYHKLAVHQRFYAALALNDLIQEVPLAVVSEKYNCNKGVLQSLQQSTSTFCGMLTIFCNRLGWHNLELLFSHFQKRVHFGIQQELCDLIQLSTLNAQRARVLYNAGYETISSLATADPDELELTLCNAGAFESEKQLEGDVAEEAVKRREVKRIRITGKQGVNERDAALLIIKEAQNFIKHELGIKTISWQSLEQKDLPVPHENTKDLINKSVFERKNNSQNEKENEDANDNISVKNDPGGVGSVNEENEDANDNISVKNDPGGVGSVNEDCCKLNDDELPDVKKLLPPKSTRICLSDKKFKEGSQVLVDQNSETVLLNSDNHQKSMVSKKGTKSEFIKSTQNKNIFSLNKELSSATLNSSNINGNVNTQGDSNIIFCSKLKTSDQVPVMQNNTLNLNPSIKICQKNSNSQSNNCSSSEKLNSIKILQNDILVQNVSDKNEKSFFSEDVNNLFDELEKTLLDDKMNQKSDNGDTKQPEVLNFDNNLTFSQLLLSQSAELDNVYHSQSFLNSGFQNVSFSDCMDNNRNVLSNSTVEGMTSKKTRDALDALFDSPINSNVISAEEKEKVDNFQTDCMPEESCFNLSDFDAVFDTSNFYDDILNKKNEINSLTKPFEKYSSEVSNISNKNVKTDLQKKAEIKKLASEYSDDNIIHEINPYVQKTAFQSTPKGELNDAKCLENLDLAIEACSHSLMDNCDFGVAECDVLDCNIKSNDLGSDFLKSETSGDLFESEDSLDSEVLNKAQVMENSFQKLEIPVDTGNNIQSISSRSDEIFDSDKSFERMLENHPIENGVSDFNDKTSKCSNYENEGEKILKSKNLKMAAGDPLFCSENSGDIFEGESEPVFSDPKKHLSFEFEDNSEIFKTWNPSPNKIVQSQLLTKEEVISNKIHPSIENNLNGVKKESFLANVSDFSSFSSDCLEDTPPKNFHSAKSVLLQISVPKIRKSSNRCGKDKTEEQVIKNHNLPEIDLILDKSLPHLNEIKFNMIDVLDENFDNFLKLLEKAPVFGLSVACEKVEQKTAVNIGPPKLRAKMNDLPDEKIYVNDDILITGLSFCWNGKVFYLKFPSDTIKSTNTSYLTDIQSKLILLRQLFNNFTNKIIIALDIKSCYKVLWSGCNISLARNKDVCYLDPSIAAWLLDPSDGQQTLQQLVLNYWPDASHLIEGFDRGHGSLGLQYWSSVSGHQRAVTEAYISFHLIKTLSSLLTGKKLFKSFVDVEMPSILTLAKMEQDGLGFDLKLAMEYRKELQKKQDAVLKKAYQLAGRNFNIMSPKDLSRILYKELKLIPPDANGSPIVNRHLSLGLATLGSAKKLPPELKTNKECLEKIMHLHPLPKAVVDWRKLSFAVSKVLMPLLRENKFNKEFQMHRVYSTCYVYTITGRINMHTPNLQFIPRDFNIDEVNSGENGNEECYQIDNEVSLYGICLRNMFVPAKGNILLSADYSQLELRILAHLSGDIKLSNSLNSGDDIFKQIAAAWKNISLSSVTDEIRQQAKKICYGIIYGMSAKTLSHQLKTTENDASYFMDTFKRSYPGVTHYLNSVVENCRNKGYITTIMERRRYLPQILSESKAIRAQAERQAINTTIQGSAADIIKKAMIEIEKQLRDLYGKDTTQNFKTFKNDMKSTRKCCRGGFLVLQLHDELIYEVFKSDLETVKNIVKTVMERTTKLSVILPVNIKVGSSWGSMKEFT